jgi:hypothetical protein
MERGMVLNDVNKGKFAANTGIPEKNEMAKSLYSHVYDVAILSGKKIRWLVISR